MKMDVLNLKKRLSSQNSSATMCGGVIKIEPDDELDKENCEDEDYVTDLTMDRDDSSEEQYESMNHDGSSENIKEEVFETEIMEEDDEEVENPDLPVFSVIVKDENRSTSRDPLRENETHRSRVEIKYEDDIEEEEYDSDEDQSEIGSVSNMSNSDKQNPINFVNVNGRLLPSNSPGNVPYRTCFNPDYFDSSIVSFQIGSQVERNGMPLEHNDMNGDQQNKNSDKSNDSILLSIVYATINVPFSQVSKFLTAYNLSKSQLSVIRKVRRQVKNRLYAQNCRRRRVAHIKNLATELQQIKGEKEKLIDVRSDLTTKMLDMEDRYKQLYTYVMSSVEERHRNDEIDLTDDNMNENSEQTRIQKRKLAEEYEELENKKQKLEQKYDELYKHVFKVIAARNQNNGMARNGMDSNMDFKLCHMDIVNELAMLNKYWSKNNLQPNEQMDFESSISVDGSGTSEKLNDFVDFESSISVDESRTEENKLNDFIDYESSVDGSIQSENKRNTDSNSTRNNSRVQNNVEDSRTSENSLIVWSEEESEDEDDELEERLDELQTEGEELELKKKTVQERYDKLYEHVIEAMGIGETEFLKVFMDYCIRLLKAPPEGSTSSVEFDGS